MLKATNSLALSLLALTAAACSNSADSAPKSKATQKPTEAAAAIVVACDAAAINALEKKLAMANGLNVDLQDKKVQAEIEAAKADIAGKRFAFTGCTFGSQGNDEVAFGATGTESRLGCAMRGGEDGVTAFRNQAMTLDIEKPRLDVRGEIALHGMKDFERLQMTNCTIDAHE